MKTYYICPRATIDLYAEKIRAGEVHPDVHWIHTLPDGSPLPNGMAFAVVCNGDDGDLAFFESMDGVTPLPSLLSPATLTPVLTAATPIGVSTPNPEPPEHSDVYAAMGVTDMTQETTLSFAQKAAKLCAFSHFTPRA